jgi:hypothetical protein
MTPGTGSLEMAIDGSNTTRTFGSTKVSLMADDLLVNYDSRLHLAPRPNGAPAMFTRGVPQAIAACISKSRYTALAFLQRLCASIGFVRLGEEVGVTS